MIQIRQRMLRPDKAMPTIRDVARQAGVGIGTVSRVLNNNPNVSPATRQRVLAAIEALGFTPNPIARQLSSGRALTIAAVVPYFTVPSFVERLRGVTSVFAQSPYDLFLFNVETVTQRTHAFQRLSQQRVDGIIFISITPNEHEVRRLEESQTPFVLIDTYHPNLNGVYVDDTQGGRLATRHLLGLGHRCIAFISDRLDNPLGFTASRQRYAGYREALAEAGVPLQSVWHVEGEHGQAGGRELARQLLRRHPRPTAIFASSDSQALGALEAAREMGIVVPDELSIVGYDDIEIAAYLQLTTVRQSLLESGVLGAQLLLSLIEQDQPGEPEHIELPTELIQRRTTAPPPSAS